MAGRELTITPTKRERRKSPATGFGADSSSTSSAPQPPPMSPGSSVADTTFEPTIDMMVNDFDDEATLNEEEALADLEAHNAEDEIATLREESEMPIELLLAKYSSMTNMEPATVARPSSSTSSSSSRRRRAPKRQLGPEVEATGAAEEPPPACAEPPTHTVAPGSPLLDYATLTPQFHETGLDTNEMPGALPPELTKKPHRSHLLDLYPEESFETGAPHAMGTVEDVESFTPLQTLLEEVEAGEEEEEDSDTDSDDARKIIMVGPNYQAEIPEGLSQYGDILPYENEDQLIWEPSQVSERAVEDYLAKIQETRSVSSTEAEGGAAAAAVPTERAEIEELPAEATPPEAPAAAAVAPASSDAESVVKDNEQALHLLVQCGYDFKEALRRKRMNVLPLSDTMSSWSEEECQKFEEGIQKFGKDFYQIRQNQTNHCARPQTHT
ncbi:mesoderm induction early response protein 1 isoform X2 [Drosophila montana]|uniref:mesoderm induction early response protein 1 isoform X2 n=1 Tax=Drosophila montana TaxID=40370 RepID=UPI00313E00CC